MDAKLIKKSIYSLVNAEKHNKRFLDYGIDTMPYDGIQECLIGFLSRSLSEENSDAFMDDLYSGKTPEQIIDRYFPSLNC